MRRAKVALGGLMPGVVGAQQRPYEWGWEMMHPMWGWWGIWGSR